MAWKIQQDDTQLVAEAEKPTLLVLSPKVVALLAIVCSVVFSIVLICTALWAVSEESLTCDQAQGHCVYYVKKGVLPGKTLVIPLSQIVQVIPKLEIRSGGRGSYFCSYNQVVTTDLKISLFCLDDKGAKAEFSQLQRFLVRDQAVPSFRANYVGSIWVSVWIFGAIIMAGLIIAMSVCLGESQLVIVVNQDDHQFIVRRKFLWWQRSCQVDIKNLKKIKVLRERKRYLLEEIPQTFLEFQYDSGDPVRIAPLVERSIVNQAPPHSHFVALVKQLNQYLGL